MLNNNGASSNKRHGVALANVSMLRLRIQLPVTLLCAAVLLSAGRH